MVSFDVEDDEEGLVDGERHKKKKP